jgi:tetratricopeptide (TPR) repeat protein
VTAADQLARTWMALPAADWAAWWQQAAAGLPTSALAWALKRLSDAAWTTDPPATAAVADRAEWLAAQAGGAEVDALAAWTRGIALLAQGSMEAALVAVDRAGNGFAAIGRPQERAQTQISRLMALAMLGRYDEAVRCGEQARDVRRRRRRPRRRQDRAQPGQPGGAPRPSRRRRRPLRPGPRTPCRCR